MKFAKRGRTHPHEGQRRSRHALILRAVVVPLCVLLAVACGVLGYLNATMWEPSREITARTNVNAATQYVVTDPGVLALVDSNVSIDVKATDSAADSKQQMCVAIGTSRDVAGWLAGQTYTRITGMSSWNALQTQRNAAAGTPVDDSDSVAFKESDMWRSVTCGDGHVNIKASDVQTGEVAVIDRGSGDTLAATTISLHWVRTVLPDYATPLYFVAGLLAVFALLAGTVFAMADHRRRKHIATRAHVKHHEEVPLISAVAGSLSVLVGKVKPTSNARRRRGGHRKIELPQAEESAEQASPLIVDPASRNLVADEQNEQDDTPPRDDTADTAEAESTESDLESVTPQELLDYLARLSSETLPTATDDDVRVERASMEGQPEQETGMAQGQTKAKQEAGR